MAETRVCGSVPCTFPGTAEERAANRATHQFDWDEDARCWNCDARAGGFAAEWPCGSDVPRRELNPDEAPWERSFLTLGILADLRKGTS